MIWEVSLPQPWSNNDATNEISLGNSFHHGPEPSSGGLSALVKRAGPEIPDHVTFSFSRHIDVWKHHGTDKNDEDKIRKAIAFLKGTDKTQPQAHRRRVAARRVPTPGGADYREELIEMIAKSCHRINVAIHERNTSLKRLSEIKHSRNITNPHPPNVYVTFWMENQIQLPHTAEANHLPVSKYLFGKNCRGGDITKEIGLPEPMANVAPLPEGWTEFKPEELIDMAKEISKWFPSIRWKVMDDTNAIIQAISALRHNASIQKITCSLKTYELPKKDNFAGPSRKQLINMIDQSWRDLHRKVWDRNSALKRLDELQVSLDDVGNAEPTNIYVAYWKEIHRLPAKPISGTNPTARESSSGASNPTPNKRAASAFDAHSKRLREPSRQPVKSNDNISADPDSDTTLTDSESTLNEMLEETKIARQRRAAGSGSLTSAAPGNDGRTGLPAAPWTASSTLAGPYNPPISVDPALMAEHHYQEEQELPHTPYNDFFDFEAYMGSPFQEERKSVTGKE
ncbi:hypothetical protein H0H93_013437 [Arthromyces matolae]|nr:hypothetical protein H0H93_013437 [Arthromyces matolae]